MNDVDGAERIFVSVVLQDAKGVSLMVELESVNYVWKELSVVSWGQDSFFHWHKMDFFPIGDYFFGLSRGVYW